MPALKHASFGPVSLSPTELGASITRKLTGLDRTLGLEITHASFERVEARLVIDDRHRQIHGLVHGGVYTSIVETVGSVGAWVADGNSNQDASNPSGERTGRDVVGLDNHTSFVRAVREGTLHVLAEPIHRGRRTQLWEVRISDDQGRLAASGRLRSMYLESPLPPAPNTPSPDGERRS